MTINSITEIPNPNTKSMKPIKEKQDIYIPDIIDENISRRNGMVYCLTGSGGSGKSSLLLNLMKNKIELPIHILDIVIHFQNLAIKFIDEENRVNEVDEITEVLNIVISMIYEIYKTDDKWINEILPKIKMFSMFKIKEKVSLSSRSIFKYKDIMDKINK